jgi:hypothetical protein
MRILSLFIALIAHLTSIEAQELKFTATSSLSKAAVGEQIKIIYSLNTMGSGFKVPDLSNFEVLMGPQQMFSSQNNNGKVSQSLSYTFVISGIKPGRFTIPPASIKVGNGKMESNALQIEIIKSAASNNSDKVNDNVASNNNDLFARAIVSKVNTTVGDQIVVTYKIYTKHAQLSYELSKAPSFNGFYTEEIALAAKPTGVQETINGQSYLSAEIKKLLAFPQKSGKLEIPPLELNCVVKQRVQPRNMWEQVLGGGYKDVEVKIKSAPLIIDVKELDPTNKPADYDGAVGKFEINASLEPQQLNAGDAASLKITISGKGNLKLIDPLKLQLPEELELYDPQIKDNISVSSGGMTGSRTFEYLIIPRAGGNYKIGPLNFSWYDAEKRAFQSKSIPEFDLNVEKGDGTASINKNKAGKGALPKKINNDIRFIKKGSGTLQYEAPQLFFLSVPFYLSSGIAPLLLVAFLLIRKRRLHRERNKEVIKVQEAGTSAIKRLKKASEFLLTNQKDNFYEEVYRALNTYFSDKLKLPASSLNRQILQEILNSRNVPATTVQNVLATLDACEFARFAPGAAANMKEVYEQAATCIHEIEEAIKS